MFYLAADVWLLVLLSRLAGAFFNRAEALVRFLTGALVDCCGVDVVLDLSGISTVVRRANGCLRDSLTAVLRGGLWGEGLAMRLLEKVQFAVLKLRRDVAGIQERGMRLLPVGTVERDSVDFDLV